MCTTIRDIEVNYNQYCKDKREIKEVPLSYCDWLQLEVLAWMEKDKIVEQEIVGLYGEEFIEDMTSVDDMINTEYINFMDLESARADIVDLIVKNWGEIKRRCDVTKGE